MRPDQQAIPSIDIVIPVFGNFPAVRRCLESVRASRSAVPTRVLVIDDASVDRETVSYLDGLRSSGAIDLLRLTTNSGFVVSANLGLSASRNDVILLNSDTEVHDDWVDRLVRCASGAPDIGTVTPFSNAATICSYPFPAHGSRLPCGLTSAHMDRLFARANPRLSADLPTGVGFCLFVRRDCLDAVGPFDEARFGRGYGEETDFCLRARARGWRSVVCADTFVYHEGRATFGAQAPRRARDAEHIVRAAHSHYARELDIFFARDPLAAFRRRVDAERTALSMCHRLRVVAERTIERAALHALRSRISGHRRLT